MDHGPSCEGQTLGVVGVVAALKNHRVLWIIWQLQSTTPKLHGWGERSALLARSSAPSLETSATSGATPRL